MARSRRPAEGERAAIGGYYPQYLMSSEQILRRLDEGRLEWIRLADPEAGRLDDFQIATPARVDAFQFKWSGQAGAFNYADLTYETRDAKTGTLEQPSLIAQLADGWQRLKLAHPGRRVVVHLVTNDFRGPNPSATIPYGDPPPARRSFAAFFAEAWAAARSGTTVPTCWQPALDELRARTGLDTATFVAFLRDCELEFAASLPTRHSETREAGLRWEHLQGLVAFLQGTIQAGGVVELTLERLLRSLGWEGRYATRFRHEFPDPRIPYRAISTTERQLEDRLAQLRGGYLAVIGPPGSGKSVLLTKTLRRPRAERVIRYYAYVPDAQDPAASRGESANFLHDVCLSLQQAGISTEGSHLPDERELLLDRFHRQLILLGEEFRTSGRRTIILIDGLDHIDRELRPTRSLLADLPRPDQIPDGVFLVLGSQTDQVPDLAERVRHALDQDGRRVHIARLDRASVRFVVENAGLPFRPSREHLARLFELCDGHPLALNYLIQVLRATADECQVAEILAREEPYHGDIEAQYRTFWQSVRNEAGPVRLLAAVARLRGGIDLDKLAAWFGGEAVGRLVEAFARYFVAEPDGRRRFFHNSFRVFLARETARDYAGQDPKQADRLRYRDLAERLAAEPTNSTERWEELYHRVSAGDHEGVCRLATQSFFREQVFALRPLEAVKKDIEIALPSAAERDDVRAYSALTLARAEAVQREQLLGDLDLPGLLLDLGEVGLAVEAIRDGNRLRIGSMRAMELAKRLDDLGETAEAGRLFELAEPLDMLAGSRGGGDGGNGWRVIDAWAATAPRFRPIEEVFATLAAAQLGGVHFGVPDETSEARLRVRLLQSVGFSTIATRRWADLEATLDRIPYDEEGRNSQFWLLHWACRAIRGDQGARFADRLREVIPREALSPQQRLHLADLLLRQFGDEIGAREVLDGLALPMPDLDHYEQDEDFRLFGPLLLHATLLYRLGENRDAMQLVPDGSVPDRAGRIWFLRDVVTVARIKARAVTGPHLNTWEVRQEVAGIMQRFNRSFPGSDVSYGWSSCRQARLGLYQRLASAVAGHGPTALHALRNEFELQWQGEKLRYWPASLRLGVALAFAGMHEDHREWAIARVRDIEDHQPQQNPYDLVHDSQKLAQAWLELDQPEDAVRLISGVMRGANGIVGEDYQFESWLDWLDQLATIDPGQATGKLDWFAGAIAVLHETADGRVASSAAYRLIRLAARLDPGRGVRLARWLMDRGVVDHPDRVKAYLDGIVESPQFPSGTATYAIADLVVPFEPAADEALARTILLAVHRGAGSEPAGRALSYLARRVATDAMPNARYGWTRGIRDAATQLGLPIPPAAANPSDPAPEDDERDAGRNPKCRPPDILVLKDEGGPPLDDAIEMRLDEVLARGSDAEALADLARREHYSSDFDWIVAADRLSLRSPRQLMPLVRALRHNKRRMLSHLLGRSRACVQARRIGEAWDFASLAIEITDRYGWSQRYSDGSRFDATRALIEAQPAEGRRQLWHLLVGDAGTDPTSLAEAVAQLREVPPIREVWPEVEEYLRAMFDERLAGFPALDFAPVPAAASPAAALACMLLDDIDHPVALLSRAARRACAWALLDGDPDVIRGLDALLKDEHRCRTALEVLDAASHINGSIAELLTASISALANSRDALVAVMARDLLGRSGDYLPPELQSEPLPAAYRVALRDQALRGVSPLAPPSAGEPWPDSEDPRQLLAVVTRIYRMLSQGTGIPLVTLMSRGVRLMHAVETPATWSAQGEQTLHRRLAAAGLSFTYRRPRSDVAFRATSRLIGELWRARSIPEEGVRILIDFLRMCDPALALAEPQVRPAQVPTIPCETWGDSQAVAWLDDAGSSLAFLGRTAADGRVVLAEASRLEAIGRGLRYETRLSVLHEIGDAAAEGGESIAKVSWVRLRDYPDMMDEEEIAPPVIRHSTGATDENPAGEWLAFNPALARSLGWSLAPEGLFRWLDSQGRIMVESLWWLDGPIGRRGMLAQHNCVGEGWLVLADPRAMDAIAGIRPNLRRLVTVNRGATLDEGGERTRSARQSGP